MKSVISSYLKQVSKNFINLESETDNISKAALEIIEALSKKNKILFCGNGGSAGDSQHLAAELMGRYKINRDPLPALALTVDTSAITAIGNDYGYENVFSRQLKGIGVKGDVLVAISTSGKSENVIKAIEVAKQIGIKVISFTGEAHCQMNELSDICINVPSKETNHIQEMHITVGQLICGIVEDTIFGEK